MATLSIAKALTERARVDFGLGDSFTSPSTWLFIVPAGTRLIASAAMGGQVVFRELDAASLAEGSATWPTVEFAVPIVVGDFNKLKPGYTVSSLPDHWHIFDGTFHWIAVTLMDGLVPRGVGVVKLDVDGIRQCTEVVYDAGPAPEAGEAPPLVGTQDLWCVQRPDGGLAIGLGKAAELDSGLAPDLVVVLIDADGRPEPVWFTGFGDGATPLSRTGSATWVPSNPDYPYQLVIPAGVGPCAQNPIYLVQVTEDWRFLKLSTMLSAHSLTHVEGYGFGMPTQVTLANGHRAIAVRRIDLRYRDAEPDCVKSSEDDLNTDDCSPIVLLIYDTADNLVFPATLITDRGTRPHISAVGSTLYVCYDTADMANDVGFSCHVVVFKYSVGSTIGPEDLEHIPPVLPPDDDSPLPPDEADPPVYSPMKIAPNSPAEVIRMTTTLSSAFDESPRSHIGRADPMTTHPDYADWLLTPSRRQGQR